MEIMFLLVLGIAMTFCGARACATASEHVQLGSPSVAAHRCEPIATVPFCMGLGYEFASFPNMMNHQRPSDANRELSELRINEAIDIGCSDHISHLLCSMFAPICIPQFPDFVPPPPCKEICDYTRQECEPILEENGLQWPTSPVLNCSSFVSKGGHTPCTPLGAITLSDQLPDASLPGPVEQFSITAEGAHTLTFSWKPPRDTPASDQLSYILECVPHIKGFPHFLTMDTELVTFEGFEADSEYECSVAIRSGNTTGSKVSALANTLAPIGLQFVNDTPIVENMTIRAQIKLARPASTVTCQLLDSIRKNCSNGRVTFSSLSHGTHVLRVVAENSQYDRVVLRRRVKVPSHPDTCAVLHINGGDVTATSPGGEGNVTIEFTALGPVESFACKLDNATAFNCSSPLTLPTLDDGEHVVKIIPRGKSCRKKKYSYSVRF